MEKETKVEIGIILVLGIFLGILVILGIKMASPDDKGLAEKQEFGKMEQEIKEKETKKEEIERGEEVEQNTIDLSQYTSNITITKAGEYTLKGAFQNAVLIDAEGDVTLVLENVTIQNSNTCAIGNIGTNSLTLQMPEGTINTLSDGGESEYDACVYSTGKLILEGEGTLNVQGNQEEGEGIATETNEIVIKGGKINIESQDDGINSGGDGGQITIEDGEIFIKAQGDGIDSNQNMVIQGGSIYTMGSPNGGDAGIDTDAGFIINGGTVIALGSDMLEKPEESSKQKAVCFTFQNKIEEGSKITLRNEQNIEVFSFEAKQDFRTLILSNDKIQSGTYYIEKDGEKIQQTVQVR